MGDLFSNSGAATGEAQALIDGKIKVPLTTYFTVGDRSLPGLAARKLESNSDELCENLIFLGRKGHYKTSEGIRIVTLGGRCDDTASAPPSPYEARYSKNEARALLGLNAADILITNQWPQDISLGSKVEVPQLLPAEVKNNKDVTELCAALRPRYHFSTIDNNYYEREPFSTPTIDDSKPSQITRFISLGSFNNPSKAKFLSAFNLDITTPPIATADTTVSPFTLPSKKRPSPSATNGESYSAFARFSNSTSHEQSFRGKRRKKTHYVDDPSSCFFCLHNPACDRNLVVSIGLSSILTIPKGPITLSSGPNQTFPALGQNVPAHIQIIPQAHSSTNAAIDAAPAPDREFNAAATFAEMSSYRQALCAFVAEKGGGKLGAVLWETSRSRIRHYNWHFVPMEAGMVRSGLVRDGFRQKGKIDGCGKFEEVEAEKMIPAGEGDFFRMWTWTPAEVSTETSKANGDRPADPIAAADSFSSGADDNDAAEDAESTTKGTLKSYLCHIGDDDRFNVNFGRSVVCALLRLEDRLYWDQCAQPEDEEKADAARFMEAFKEFDFTMDPGFGS